MFNGFMTELFLASLMIALPALFVVIYQWGEKNGKKQIEPRFIEIRSHYRPLAELRQARQQRLDDNIFKTVEEYRNGVD